MIRGAFNERLQPMVAVEIADGDGQYHPVEALLDTGFSGHLTLPPYEVARLGLTYVDRTPLTLAGDQQLHASVYEGLVKWLGQPVRAYVIAMDGPPCSACPCLRTAKSPSAPKPPARF